MISKAMGDDGFPAWAARLNATSGSRAAMANGRHYGQAYARVRVVGALLYVLPPEAAFEAALAHAGVAPDFVGAFRTGWDSELI